MNIGKFFSHYAADPYFNMAFDEWLFFQGLAEPDSFYLRLYSWLPGGITFGSNQNLNTALNFNEIKNEAVIRRVTGGRAIYHDRGELTYSIVIGAGFSDKILSDKGLTGLNRQISEALIMFLNELGITSEYVRKSSLSNSQRSFFHKMPCFASQAKYEILSEDKKIIASAQRRYENCLLQHGSIKVNGTAQHPALQGLEGITDEMVTGIDRDEFDMAEDALKIAFQSQFELEFVTQKMRDKDQKEMEKFLKNVRENAFEKRDIFKQKIC